MSKKIKELTIEDFETVFGEQLSDNVKAKISEYTLDYEEVKAADREKLIIKVLEHISSGLKKAGKHRADEWISGWAENRDEVEESIIPKYFGKFPHVRWAGEFIEPKSENFEYNMARILQYWMFEKYLSDVDFIYEFGCGTGHNLFRARDINPKAQIWGLDWASSSQETINKINKVYNKDFLSKRFDFFEADKDFTLGDNSGVYTFAALEQIGPDHTNFIDYLIEQSPTICLHIEPIAELLDPENRLTDYLSVEYFKERNYLSNFYNHLKDLENDGRIDIIEAKRSNIGSFYVDGYSIVAWRPSCQR